jgi:hypothetical protein
MSFKGWLLTETILVQYMRETNGLFPVDGPFLDFNYQSEKSWTNFVVGCWQAKRPGYISISSRPTHVAIIKHSPLEDSLDFGFLKNLIQLLQQNRLKGIPYKEVGTSFDDLFKKVNYEPEFKPETGWQTGETLPDVELGASNMQKLSPGISASKQSGSWAFFIEASEAQFYIPKLIAILEQAAAPLIQNNLIDFYEVVDRKTGKRNKIVYSQKGQQESDDWKTKDNKAAATLKYLAATLLSGAPIFKTEVMKSIGHDDIKGGGQGWFGHDAPVQNFNVPLDELYKLNERAFADNMVIRTFLNAVKGQDKQKFQDLEKIAQWAEKKKQTTIGQKYPPYWIGGALEVFSWLWEKNNNIKDMTNPSEVMDNIYNLQHVMKYEEILQQIEPEEFEYFKKQAKEAIETAFESGAAQHLRPNDIISLNELAPKLNLHPSILQQLEQGSQHHKDEEAKRKKEQQEEALKHSFLMDVDSYAYMMVKEGKWQAIPDEFLEYISGGDYQVKVGELSLDILGEENVGIEDAMSRAEEEAWKEVKQKPSESYGEDKSEIESDIEYDWDDFIQGLEEIDEDTPEEEAVRIIREKYWDDFVEWKKKKMQKEEEQESWKYEPDTESNDFQIKVSEYQQEIAEEMAWEEGLVIIQTDIGKAEIQLHKNHWEQFKSILKRTIELNMREKNEDQESYWKASTKISIDFIPKGGFTKDAYTLSQELIR